MQKKIIGVAIMAAIAVTAGWSISHNNNEPKLSNVILDNIEALAIGENPFCENGCVNGSGGCYCYGDYPQYAEYRW